MRFLRRRGIGRQVFHSVSPPADILSDVRTVFQSYSAFCMLPNQTVKSLLFHLICRQSPVLFPASSAPHDCFLTNSLCPPPLFEVACEHAPTLSEGTLDLLPEEPVDYHSLVPHTPSSSKDEVGCRTPLQFSSSNRLSTCQYRGRTAPPLLFFRQRSRRRFVDFDNRTID